MARALQDKYRDYNRRKVAPFRQMVDHAYQIVLHSYGLGSNSNSDADDYQSEGSIELLDEDDNDPAAAPNVMVDVMNSLYTKKPTTPATDNSVTVTTIATGAASSSSAVAATSSNPPSNNAPQMPANNRTESAPIDISSDEDNDEPVQTNNATLSHPIAMPPGIELRPLNTNAVDVSISNGVDALKIAEKRGPRTDSDANGTPQQSRKKRKIGPIQAPDLALIKPPSTSSSGTKKSAPKKDFPAKTSTLTFSDVGGLDKILKELCELLLHLKHPELYEHIGLSAPRGFLLHGPPGSGKTLLANAIAGQLKVPLIEVAATELVAGISGESEERIREVFEKAATVAPCVLFIDEVDVVSANRNNAQKDLERRIVSQLLSSLDGLGQLPNGNQVVVIGATNRADTLDPALRRVGRFDQEICLGIPDRQAREQILKIVCQKLKIEDPFSFDDLAMLTPGYVGADLLALAMRAATIAVKRVFGLKAFSTEAKEGVAAVEAEHSTEPIVNVEEIPNAAASGDLTNGPPIEDGEKGQEMEVDQGGEGEAAEEVTQEKDSTTSEIIDGEKTPGDKEEDAPSVDMLVEAPAEGDTLLKKATVGETTRQHSLEEMIEWLNSDNKTPLTKEEIEALRVTMEDFKAALLVVQPSAKREGFITVPDVTWENIGSLGDIRDELKLAILAPVKYPKRLEQLGLQSPSGVLLCGPPGCGKTLLAKAVANEAGINFISVKGPELLNMYVGESERAVRQCFQRAKNSAPCVIFFDEFDALCPKRSNRSENTSGARVVNQLLTEMDGVEDRRGVFLMAATNRPDMIDGAVMRPGRLDKILYVGLPDAEGRTDILRAQTKVSLENGIRA